jgi:hypothetical protein
MCKKSFSNIYYRMVHFEQDYIYGITNQKRVLPFLQLYFRENIQQVPDKWSKYDFHSENALFELKSRKNCKNQYPTTLLTCNKVLADAKKKLHFVFDFKDELCYIPYEESKFRTFEKRLYSRINQSEDEKEYYFIPIEQLKTIRKNM